MFDVDSPRRVIWKNCSRKCRSVRLVHESKRSRPLKSRAAHNARINVIKHDTHGEMHRVQHFAYPFRKRFCTAEVSYRRLCECAPVSQEKRMGFVFLLLESMRLAFRNKYVCPQFSSKFFDNWVTNLGHF